MPPPGSIAVPRSTSPRRAVWQLAWPVIVAMLSESLVGLVDMLMVAQLGGAAVAAVGVGGQILGAVAVVVTAVGTGTVTLVARGIGARDAPLARSATAQSMVAAMILGTAMSLPVFLVAEPLVGLFGVESEVVAEAGLYVRTVMLSVAPGAVLFVIGSALRGAGDTRTPLWVGLGVNVINVFANWVLIFGNLGFPALGVLGSALATSLSFTAGGAVATVLVLSKRLRIQVTLADLRPDSAMIRRVLYIGYPAGIEQLMMQIGFLIYLTFAARYGTDAIAAYFIGVRILALSFLPGFGFAAAASTLVGQNLGARNPDRAADAGWRATRMSVGFMCVGGLGVMALAEPIAYLFVDETSVVAGTVSFLYMLGLSQPFMAIDFTLGGALRGAGDTRFPLWTMLVAFYAVRLGTSALVVWVLDLSLAWLWATLIGDYMVRALLKGWRFHSGRWRTIEV